MAAAHPFAAALAAGAAALGEPALARLADDVAAPLRVRVAGRPGAGRRTVGLALRAAGVTLARPGQAADLGVYVFVETLTDEDRAALASPRPPCVAVCNKADLSGFRDAGPIAAAAARCRRIQRRTGVPTRPLAGLLALAAGSGALDDDLYGGLRALAAEAGVEPRVRQRLLAELDLFGVATAVAALRSGTGRGGVATLLRQVSGIADVCAQIRRGEPAARYRRVGTALAALTALAVAPGGAAVADFLTTDSVVAARMAAAMEVMGPGVPDQAPAAGDRLRRACARDIARGKLRRR